ncbi:MAG TPA: DUF1553 domain-containing protein, partial [Longimicrobiaceae bacterium]|nr:DUF1553 domain-containing protein [Longimicrobiaceae bacterium]
ALTDDERALLETAGDDAAEARKAIEARLEVTDEEAVKALDEEATGRHEEIGKQIEALQAEKPDFEYGLVMTDAAGEIGETFVLEQGDYRHETEPVKPGILSVFDPGEIPIRAGANPNTSGRRLTLAQWVASAENPLTSRVLVNRVWQGHFGQGIVGTANDFGLAGERPSHPELLDWLASVFVRDGWSLKRLHRLIVTSSAYRQASSVGEEAWRDGNLADSANRLFWRQHLRRLSAEQLHDALLLVSGRLPLGIQDHSVPVAGGPPVWPELPPEVLQANPAFLDDNETKTKGWYPSPPEERDVRGIYLVQKRTVRIPFMETFDLPENSTSCGRRTESVVAPQALSLLNGPLAIEAAKSFARRIEERLGGGKEECGVGAGVDADADELVAEAFRLAVQRPPTSVEAEACRSFVEQRSLAELCRVLLNLNEFIYVD